MDPLLIAKLMLVHFISDFLLQSDWMAQNKSKSTNALALHCFTYSLPFLVFLNFHFVCFLYVTHMCVDAVTSRITSRMFARWFSYHTGNPDDIKETPSLHYFFCVIGFDQWLHLVTILVGVTLYHIK